MIEIDRISENFYCEQGDWRIAKQEKEPFSVQRRVTLEVMGEDNILMECK